METATNICLKITDLKKDFSVGEKHVQALRGVNLIVNEGEFVAIMGPSGCGKSTLLHLSSGLAEPDSGRIEVAGQAFDGFSDYQLTIMRRRKIGLIFQSFNLINNLNARENVLLPLSLGAEVDDSRRCENLFAKLGITGCEERWPETLSGGQQQRVAIARALINNPAIIFADEPTGSLDFANGQMLCELLRELCTEEKRTILLVTHEPAVAAWANRVLVMKDGVILDELNANGDSNILAAAYHELIAKSNIKTLKAPAVGGLI